MTAALLAGPALEPVSLADVKQHLRLDQDDEDTLLLAAIATARIHVEVTTRRCLIEQSWRVYRDAWPEGRRIALPLTPLIAVDAVTFYGPDGAPQTLDPSRYRPDPARNALELVGAPPPAPNGIEIDVVVGHGTSSVDVPGPLRQAILMLVAHFHEHRGAVGHDLAGHVPPAGFEALVAPFRVPVL